MKILVLMPFKPAFNAVFDAILQSAHAAAPGWPCSRVDEDLRAGRIQGKIDAHLRSANLCIADITGYNPNVLWESGFAEALRTQLIAVSQTTTELPFNIHDITTIRYNLDDLPNTLTGPLTNSIRQSVTTGGARTRLRIAITGSRGVSRDSVKQVLHALAEPYLGAGTEWYCGTLGQSDEAIAEFLFEKQQRVTGIFTSNYEVSDEIQAMFEAWNGTLLNAEAVPLPRAHAELSWRDNYFVNYADLFIMLWNGQEGNTGYFLRWLQNNKKNHIVGFTR